MSQPAPTRRYIVRGRDGMIAERMVRTISKQAAIAYVAAGTFEAELATPDDIERLVAMGVRTDVPGEQAPIQPAGGRARRMTARNHSRPWASTFAHRSGGKRMERCTSFSASGLRGRPPGFLGCSMRLVYVMHKPLAHFMFV